MENTSNISWVLVGARPASEEETFTEEVLQKLMNESFDEKRLYSLFLCGAEMDKTGTLEEMETGFILVMKSFKEYKEGDYCIIAKHDEGDLLFLPIIDEEKEEEKEEKDA